MTLLTQTVAVARKDLAIEVRGRHASSAAIPFAATVLMASGLALGPGPGLLRQVAAGLLWLAVLFGAILTLRASYRAEAEDDALEGLVLSSIDRAAVFLGKTAAVVLELLLLEVVIGALCIGLFDLQPAGDPLLLLATLGLGTIGVAGVGSLFAIVAESGRAGEGLLPLLVLPLATPVLLAGVRATQLASGGQGSQAGPWLGLLAAFDLSFTAVGVLVFGPLLEER